MFKEVSCLIANKKILSVTKGSSGGVKFDFFVAWEEWKKNKFDKLIMVHTHPNGMDRMSSIDKNMLAGWCKAFPIPIYFVVLTLNEFDEQVGSVYLAKNKKNTVVMEYLGELNTNYYFCIDLFACSYDDDNDEYFNKFSKNYYDSSYISDLHITIKI